MNLHEKFVYNGVFFHCRTLTIGYGEAPQDQISLTIIIVISAGLGIPFVLILFGGVAIGIKKNKLLDKDSKYERVPDTQGSINT